MNVLAAIGGGLAGATSLTILHELTRSVDKDAPRMDLMGMEAVSKGFEKAGKSVPSSNKLYSYSLAGDIISNALYYSLAGIGGKKNILPKGSVLGLAAGLGALILPSKVGLNENHNNRTLKTQLLTTGFYLVGGLVASFVAKRIEKKQKQQHVEHQLWV